LVASLGLFGSYSEKIRRSNGRIERQQNGTIGIEP
jgi:hypothetical protein